MLPLSDSDLVRRSRPIINLTLIGLCAAVFVYELVIGPMGRAMFFYQFGLIPAELVHGFNYDTLKTPTGTFNVASPIPTWMTIFTSMFVHGDWAHFAFNMLFLWVFGDNIEDRFGHLRYLLFYLAAGVAAVWFQTAINTMSEIPTIGASGAIAGVLGAYLIIFPRSRIRTLVFFFFIIFIRIPAVFLLGFWFLMQFVGGIGSLGPSAQAGGVAYWAHVGGFLLGIIVALFYRLATRQRVRVIKSEPTRYWRGRPL